MNSFKWMILGLVVTTFLTGCTHTEKVKAITEESSRPADDLGALEVSLKTNPWAPSNWGSALKEIFTLSFADTSYETRLKKKLVKVSKKYKADQIVKVTFWPDLNSGKFPNGKVHGRGEMVRYRRFEAQA